MTEVDGGVDDWPRLLVVNDDVIGLNNNNTNIDNNINNNLFLTMLHYKQ